jgi:hypothetical protein
MSGSVAEAWYGIRCGGVGQGAGFLCVGSAV